MGKAGNLNHLLRDNYETPLFTPVLGGGEVELQQLESVLKLSVEDFLSHARTLSSPDELSVYVVKQLMRQQAPSLLWLTLHDIDIAHTGAFSLYVDAIRRTDRLCADVWKAVQNNPEYAGNTTMFILPDFGRDADFVAGGNGFQHHRTGDAASRTTWMMALGAGVREGVVYDRVVQPIDLVPTIGGLMGFRHDAHRASLFGSCSNSCSLPLSPPHSSSSTRRWHEMWRCLTWSCSGNCHWVSYQACFRN